MPLWHRIGAPWEAPFKTHPFQLALRLHLIIPKIFLHTYNDASKISFGGNWCTYINRYCSESENFKSIAHSIFRSFASLPDGHTEQVKYCTLIILDMDSDSSFLPETLKSAALGHIRWYLFKNIQPSSRPTRQVVTLQECEQRARKILLYSKVRKDPNRIFFIFVLDPKCIA